MTNPIEDKFLTLKDVLNIVGCKTTTWYNLVSQGKAPQPYRPYCTKSVRWSYLEIQKWISKNKDNKMQAIEPATSINGEEQG